MNPMTRDEQRERLAVLCGWKVTTNWELTRWVKDGKPRFSHPFPDGDLTALAKAMPDGIVWVIERFQNGNGDWVYAGRARRRGTCIASTLDKDTEYDARLALTIAVLEAAKEQTDATQ